MITDSAIRHLHRLARLYGVQRAYFDVHGRYQEASAEALLAVLKTLGAPVENMHDAPAAIKAWRQAYCDRCIEPVVVAWDGHLAGLDLRLPSGQTAGRARLEMERETGEIHTWTYDLSQLSERRVLKSGNASYAVKRLPIHVTLPSGYHRLSLETSRKHFEAMVIATPKKAYQCYNELPSRMWGIFLPLYALHSERSWGAGDFSDLRSLIDWLTSLGGSVVATLPLLAAFLDEPFDPSPYAPVSRLLWNEFYVDVSKVDEARKCVSAKRILASNELQNDINEMRLRRLVDYKNLMALKRAALEEMCRCCFAEPSARLNSLQKFAETHPFADAYARFRAICERQRKCWPQWQSRLRRGQIQPGDYKEEVRRYHLYAQWLAHCQIDDISRHARRKGTALYLDFPLGSHPHGFDVWRNQELFPLEASVGAPPDACFTGGQDWGFPPPNPEVMRQQKYDYLIACVRHHLSCASILRIDHVMGLHRLFWIPKGIEPKHGVYVRYHADELYAILALESHRNRAMIVGEDLGTVPSYVRPAMKRHGFHRTYVMQYELVDSKEAIRPVPAASVASLNTHDMPPFAAFWQMKDIGYRRNLNLLDDTSALYESEHRHWQEQNLLRLLQLAGFLSENNNRCLDVVGAILALLSISRSRLVLVNLEDLWLETEPQNVPGTFDQYPNWQRKAQYSLEKIRNLPQVMFFLHRINAIRKGKRP